MNSGAFLKQRLVTPDDVAQLFNDIPSDDRITIESVIPYVADILDSD